MERELLLLGLLQKENMHGYGLHEFIDNYLQTCVDLKKSTAYYLLEKLQREGYITGSEEREGNRPSRLVYRLTTAGEARFFELLRQNLAAYLPATFAGDTGLAFLDDLPSSEAVQLLTKRRERLVSAMEIAEMAPQHGGALQLIVEHQRLHLRSELDWLDRVIEGLLGTARGAVE